MPARPSATSVRDQAQRSIEALGWAVGKFLGEGAFGKVFLVTKAGTTAACKIIEKPIKKKELDMIHHEIQVMQSMNNPYICKLYEAFETEKHFFLFLELMTGGEVFDKIVELGFFTEKMAATITTECLMALRYVHSRGIVHRDLKPENLLLENKEPNARVKLVDFGLSGMYDAQSALMTEPAGTPGYQAPEVLSRKNGGYDQQVDVWSMGVIVYILLSGRAPFGSATPAKETAKIKAGDYSYPDEQWAVVSSEAKAFIDRMLVVDPTKRATIDELLKHPWLKDAVAALQKHSAVSLADSAGSAKSPNLKAREGYNIKETELALASRARFAGAWAKLKALNALQAAGRKSIENKVLVGAASNKKLVHFSNDPGPPPQLPRGWSAHLSKDGSKYWYSCDVDNSSTWEVPSAQEAVETDLPMGWTAHRADDGKRWFYWCGVSQQALWEPPGAERAVKTKLPRGWTANLADDKIHFYYFCAAKDQTQWEVPEPWQAYVPQPRQKSAPAQVTVIKRKSQVRLKSR